MSEHILIIGAGEFGLSAALSLLERTDAKITILDRSPTLPNPSGSSVDTNRIIRADYASRPYSALAAEAQVYWRDQSDSGWGGQGRYSETGFALVAENGSLSYVHEALENVRLLAKEGLPLDLDKIAQLRDKDDIRRVTGYQDVSGDAGYVNWNSGWANAEETVRFALEKVKSKAFGRMTLESGAVVERLIVEENKCKGVLVGGKRIMADLTIVAAGAWTPSLIDLRGRCIATGQALAYIDISQKEQDAMGSRPVVMNFSEGMFMIPPLNCKLKVARHGFGHTCLQLVEHPDGVTRKVSVPKVGISIPDEAEEACRAFLREMVPDMADRPFCNTRLCWYCDTPNGDFLIDYHPQYEGLFIATGGSGHGFKFFPVIGDKIVDSIHGKLDPQLQKMWQWRQTPSDDQFYCEDGSRAGSRGLKLGGK